MADLPNRLDPATPLSDNLAIVNDAFDQIDAESQTKIIRNGNVATVLIGRQTGGFHGSDYGIKVAKPGKDVTTATDADLAFSSAFDSLKVVKTGDISFVYDDTNTLTPQASLVHGLGFVPVGFVYIKDIDAPGSYSPLPAMGGWNPDGTGGLVPSFVHFFQLTDTNLDIWTLDGGFGASLTNGDTFSFRYYLLQETVDQP